MSEEVDVMVTVEGGVANVEVRKPHVVVEVRDYDLEDYDEHDEFIWTDENGDRCWRYFVEAEHDDEKA